MLKDILNHMEMEIGEASGEDVIRVWNAFDDYGSCEYITPDHPLGSLLELGRNYSLVSALRGIGCIDDEI